MTDASPSPAGWPSTEPATTAASPVATATPTRERPGRVTAAGIILIVLGVLTSLLGIFFMLAIGALMGAAGDVSTEIEMPAGLDAAGALAGIGLAFGAIILAFGILQLLSGINVMPGKGWARVLGIVIAALGALLGLGGLGGGEQGSSPAVGIVLLAANIFVIWALASAGRWFVARSPA